MPDDPSKAPSEPSAAPELPKNKRLREAKLEEATASARKAGAEADKAVVEAAAARFPKSSSKGPEGTVEIGEGVGLVADLVAHAVLADAAAEVVADIGTSLSEGSKVLLVDSPDIVASDWTYTAISEQVKSEKDALSAVKGDLLTAGGEQIRPFFEGTRMALGVTGVIASIPGLVGAATDIASLFRADHSFSAREVKITSPALHAALVNRLLPKVRRVNIDKFGLLEESDLFAQFGETAALRLEVQKLATEVKQRSIVPADRKVVQAEAARKAYEAALQTKAADAPSKDGLDGLKKLMDDLEEGVRDDNNRVVPARAAVAVAEEAIEHFDTFAAATLEAPSGGGYPPLVMAALREALHASDYTHILYAGIEETAGETITRRTFLRTTVRFLGGGHVTYLLWDIADKRLVSANGFPVLAQAKMGMVFGISRPAKRIHL
jgi:hypothetical protein